MRNLRLASWFLSSALFLSLFAGSTSRCWAQVGAQGASGGMMGGASGGGMSGGVHGGGGANGGGATGGVQGGGGANGGVQGGGGANGGVQGGGATVGGSVTGLTLPGTILAAPGATVLVQPPQSGSSANSSGSGMIIAAPGSTVVVQSAQNGGNSNSAPKTTSNATKPNTLSQDDDAEKVVKPLVTLANDASATVSQRAGAIDALGAIGGDQSVVGGMVDGLKTVLTKECVKGAFPNTGGEVLCFHAVQSLGNLGWGARTALADLQKLRGINAILDGAINNAIAAIKANPTPAAPASSGNKGAANP